MELSFIEVRNGKILSGYFDFGQIEVEGMLSKQ